MIEKFNKSDSYPKLNLKSIKNISKYIKDNSEQIETKYFFPFINERDSTGKLLSLRAKNPEVTITKVEKTQENKLKTSEKPLNNVAFLSTKIRTSPRVKKKYYDKTPVGLYNPKPAYDVQSTLHFALFKSKKFPSQTFQTRSQSIDYIDISEIYKKNIEKVQSVCIEKQIPRKFKLDTSSSTERFLDMPKLNLPDYLQKYKGLYHIGEFGKSDISVIPKDNFEMGKELGEKLSSHMKKLKNISECIKEYGQMNRWNIKKFY